jgi:polyhydroxyalkanoate synthesis regulator protein
MKKINLHNNRMMYDTELKGYVRLLDIIQALKDGDEFQVINTLGQDVTKDVVIRAFAEHVVMPLETYKELAQRYYEVGEEAPPIILFPKENNYDRL